MFKWKKNVKALEEIKNGEKGRRKKRKTLAKNIMLLPFSLSHQKQIFITQCAWRASKRNIVAAKCHEVLTISSNVKCNGARRKFSNGNFCCIFSN